MDFMLLKNRIWDMMKVVFEVDVSKAMKILVVIKSKYYNSDEKVLLN